MVDAPDKDRNRAERSRAASYRLMTLVLFRRGQVQKMPPMIPVSFLTRGTGSAGLRKNGGTELMESTLQTEPRNILWNETTGLRLSRELRESF